MLRAGRLFPLVRNAGAYIGSSAVDTIAVANGSPATIAAYTIPAGVLRSNGAVVDFRVQGRLLNNTGAGRTLTLQASVAGQVVMQDVTSNITTDVAWRGFLINGAFSRISATKGRANMYIGWSGVTSPTIGTGSFQSGAFRQGPLMPPDAGYNVTWATPVVLSITATLSATHESLLLDIWESTFFIWPSGRA